MRDYGLKIDHLRTLSLTNVLYSTDINVNIVKSHLEPLCLELFTSLVKMYLTLGGSKFIRFIKKLIPFSFTIIPLLL